MYKMTPHWTRNTKKHHERASTSPQLILNLKKKECASSQLKVWSEGV